VAFYMFVVSIPPQFERDLVARRNPSVLVSIDATAMQTGRPRGRLHPVHHHRPHLELPRAHRGDGQ